MPESIAAQVAALQDQLAAQAPAEALRPFAEEQAALAVTPVPAAVPAPGTPLPDADLLDGHGEPTTLAAARGGAPAVLVFYRGAWCPYCNLTLRTYEERVRPALDARGVRLLAVSPQRPDGSLTTAETNALTFTVLSDPGNKLAAALGILTESAPAASEAQRALGIDVAAANADGTGAIPMPTTVVLDAEGVVRWIDVHPDYTTRTEPEALVEAVDRHLGSVSG
ncbi:MULTISPECIES: peroxiredoxin-like family protein [unclassified Streptomyces]|uniref:peroxiredoxin-like family protein n=1 Tax=unclassified Streptomyces TaxID=2593676 RepID=UPI00081F10B6|nr:MULTISPECIES: peroxiredoxin-like family protein [unclassified Streptomyces]MYR24916.1 redoxin domain-containing protein [Streptomyces sp. SID4945]SCD86644.1 Peroxiredoxin [Streptomyces sp. TverLS-915]SCE70218.1 Peroxiredoxin [Streptomyces sp. LcepLS]